MSIIDCVRILTERVMPKYLYNVKYDPEYYWHDTIMNPDRKLDDDKNLVKIFFVG